jgi:hypothetical protein
MAGHELKKYQDFMRKQREKLGLPEAPVEPPRPLIQIEGEEIELSEEQIRGLTEELLDTESMRFFVRRQQKTYSRIRKSAIEISTDPNTHPRDKVSALLAALKATEREDQLIIHDVMTNDARMRKIDAEGTGNIKGHITLTVAATYIDAQGNIQLLTPTGAGADVTQSSRVKDNEGQEGQGEQQ